MFKILLSIILVTFIGCGQKQETKKDTEKKIVTVAQSAKPRTLDPPLAAQVAAMTVARQIFNTLVSTDDNGNLIPEIAEKWEFENSKSIIFTIKDGIKFHNGDILTVDDVAFSLERMRIKSGTRVLVEKINGVEVLDKKRVKVTLSHEFLPLLHNLTLSLAGIISKSDTEKRGEEVIAYAPNGTGPFKMKSWDGGDILIFEAFNDSFVGKPEIDELIFKVVPEGNNRLIALETGEADIAYNVNPSDIPFITKNENLTLINKPSMKTEFLGFNTEKTPFNQKKFRQAISLILDRNGILSAVYENAGEPATSMVSPNMIGGKPTGDITYDIEKAKKLLKEINFKTPVQMKITVDAIPVNIQTAQIIQANFKEVGIDLIIIPLEWGTYLEKTAQGEHEFILGGWFPGTNDPDIVFYPLYHTNSKGAYGNRSFYSNENFDKIIEAGRVELDSEKRVQLYRKAQSILEDDLPLIPLLRKNELVVMRKNISNFGFRPNGHHVLTKIKKDNLENN